MVKRMFRVECINTDITPKKYPAMNSHASVWNLVAPGVHESLDWIQIDGKYVVSLGAHFTHQYALLSKTHSISYSTAHEICRYLSFLLDTPVTTNIGLKVRDYKNDLRGLRRILRLRGEYFRDDRDLQRILSEQFALVAESRGQFTHYLPVEPENNGLVLAFDLPTDKHLSDALVAYQQALFSVDPVGEILNFWRVLEATSRSPEERRSLLSALGSTRMLPVQCSKFDLLEGRKFFNLISKQKRFIASYVKQLIARHGSAEKVVDFLYHQRRNPSAHAAENVLRVGSGASLSELHHDAILLKLLARLSIERYYAATA